MGNGSDNRINNPPAVVLTPCAEIVQHSPADRIQPTNPIQPADLNQDLPSNEHRALTGADAEPAPGATLSEPQSQALPSGPLDVPSLTRTINGSKPMKMAVNVLLGVDITKNGVGGTVAPEAFLSEQTASDYWESFFTSHYGELYTGKSGADRRDFQEAFFAANAFLAAEASGALRGACDDGKSRIIVDYAMALAENPQAYGRLVMPSAVNMQGVFHATRAEEIPQAVKDEIVASAVARIPEDSEDGWMRKWAGMAVDRGARMLTERLRGKGESPQWDRLEARVASLDEVTGEHAPGRQTTIRPRTGPEAAVADPEGDDLVADLVAAVTPPEGTDPTKTPDATDVLGNFIAGVTGLKRANQDGGVPDYVAAGGFEHIQEAYSYFTKKPENDEVDQMIKGFSSLDDGVDVEYSYFKDDQGVGFAEVMDEMSGADLSAIGRGASTQAANAVLELQEQRNDAQAKTARLAEETDQQVREFVEAVDLGNEAVDEMSTAREIKRSDPDAPLNPHRKR